MSKRFCKTANGKYFATSQEEHPFASTFAVKIHKFKHINGQIGPKMNDKVLGFDWIPRKL